MLHTTAAGDASRENNERENSHVAVFLTSLCVYALLSQSGSLPVLHCRSRKHEEQQTICLLFLSHFLKLLVMRVYLSLFPFLIPAACGDRDAAKFLSTVLLVSFGGLRLSASLVNSTRVHTTPHTAVLPSLSFYRTKSIQSILKAR